MIKAMAGVAGAAILALTTAGAAAAQSSLARDVDARAQAITPKLIAWRRDIHQHPELGNMETRTAKLVADHLRTLGFEVKTGVAGTGVVGVLKGGRPGPVVALRADMDALPVKEENNLPFRSQVTSTYQGRPVGVMHACGHDTHVAILMATAEVLAGMRDRLPGTIKVIFQPAEEGPSDFEPDGKRVWGAKLMVDQGVMNAPKVDAVFGLHVFARQPSGTLAWRSGPAMASSDLLKIGVQGKQTHGASPWAGVDPIVVGSQIVLGLQTIASRQVEVTKEPSIVTIGQFNAGVRNNIIPDRAEMHGTIRAFDRAMQDDIHQRVERTAVNIAESAGAKAEVTIIKQYPPTANDPGLTARMEPTLKRVAGEGRWFIANKQTGAEDFAFYGEKAPALFVFLGVTPEKDLKTAAANHSPLFFADESALPLGVRTLAHLALDYMEGRPASAPDPAVRR
jgi:amidohydrolase